MTGIVDSIVECIIKHNKSTIMKQIVFFDTETTGLSITKDKIVELYMAKFDFSTAERKVAELHLFLNPGFPMPPEAEAVHHISDVFLADKPKFRDVADSILQFVSGCLLCGHNSNKYDVLLLVEEFANAGIDWRPANEQLLDTLAAERAICAHNLIATYKRYYGHDYSGDFGEAHGAKADTLATEKVFVKQILELGTTFDNDGFERHRTAGKCVDTIDIAGMLRRDNNGVICYTFGKNAGKPVLHDRNYARWMLANDFSADTKTCLRLILNGQLS